MNKEEIINLILSNIEKYHGAWDKVLYHTKRDIKKHRFITNESETDKKINEVMAELTDKHVIKPVSQFEMNSLEKTMSHRGHTTIYRIIRTF